jgi:hypothetical protein
MSILVLSITFDIENMFPFPLSPAKLISDYFDIRRCGSNNTFVLITRHFICAQNLRSVKRDAARTKKNASSIIHAAISYRELICRPNRSVIFITRKYIDVPNSLYRIAQCQSTRLLILLSSGNKNKNFNLKLNVQIANNPRWPQSETIT